MFPKINSNIKYLGSSFSSSLFSLSSSLTFCFSISSFFCSFNFFCFSSFFLFSSSSFIFLAFSLFSFSSFSASSLFCLSSWASNNVLFSKSKERSLLFFCIFSSNSIKKTTCVSLKINLHFGIFK